MKFSIVKYIFLIIFLIDSSNNIYSQTIKGKITDMNNNPIEFAEIVLYNNNTPIVSELSNDVGEFTLTVNSNGTFKILISSLQAIILEKEIEVTENLDLGLITFENTTHLQEVKVFSNKKLIEKKSDRLIYNVQNSVYANGLGGDELLKNIPRIDPTSDGFKIIGKSNVIVMVDDRILNISGEDLKNYLKSLRSENIDKIEIITSPSSKYDASGNSGLINIKLKQKINRGFDGNATTAYTQRIKPSISNSVGLNYSTEKLMLGYSFYHANETRAHNFNNDYFFENETRSSVESTKRSDKGLTHDLKIGYQFNKNISSGIYVNQSGWDNNSTRFSKVTFYDPNNDIVNSQRLPSKTLSDFQGLSVSSYFDIKLDTLGSKLNFYYNYNNNDRVSNAKFRSENFSGNFETLESFSLNKNDIKNDFNVDAGGVDFESSKGSLKIESGAKYIYFRNTNDTKFYDATTGTDIIDENISNFFKYYEKLFSSYFNISKKLTNQLNITAGLRYEYTHIEGILVSQNIINANFYGNLFPNVSLSYDPSEKHSYSFSYNKRIGRPGLFDLNPFRIYSDANNYQEGNPNLSPVLTDNIEFGYVYNGNLSITLFGSKISDNIAYITSSSDNNIIITQPKNALTTYDLGSEIGYNWKISDKINNYSSFNVSYQHSNSSDANLSDDELEGIRSTLSTNTTIILNKAKSDKLFINMFYNTPGVEENYVSKSIFFLRIGASISYFSKKLYVNAYLTDPFNSTIARNTVNYETFQFKNRIFNDNRSFNVSVTFKFGNNKSKNNERQINDSEKNRLKNDK